MEYIIIAFLLGLLLRGLKYVVKPIIKGIVGEKLISVLLSGLPKEQYILLNDVMLQGKYGAFIGCSNYPKCRYTMKDNRRTYVENNTNI